MAKDETAGKNVSHGMEDDAARLSRPPYRTDAAFQATYEGHCFCGAVAFAVHGPPKANCFCHCRSCQRLHGAPATLTSIYDKAAVQFTKGASEDLVFYSPQGKETAYRLPCKLSCRLCHSPVGNEGHNMMLVLPALIDFDTSEARHGRLPEAFRPTFHQYYATRIRDMDDDLPKFDAARNEEPLNEAAEEMKAAKEREKEEKEREEEKKKKEDKEGAKAEDDEDDDLREPSSKKQKREA